MSFTLLYRQASPSPNIRPSLAQLEQLFGALCHVGSIGPNFSFSKVPPQAGINDGETALMLYGKNQPLGRGFSLFIQHDFSLFKLVTPLPTTGHDLDMYFAVAAQLGHYLGAEEFHTEENQSFPLEGIDIFCEELKGDNRLMVKDFADERPGFAVSGILYPLHMTQSFCARLATLDAPAAEKAFADCLAQKQKPGYYYLSPNYYRKTQSGDAVAIYALSNGVDSIIPKEPFIPYGAGPFGEENVKSWQVALIQNGIQAVVLATLPYAQFIEALTPSEKEDFDDVHYLLHALSLPRLHTLAAAGEVPVL